MSEINLSWYDLTQLDIIDETAEGTLPTAGAWMPLVPLFKRARFGIGENRVVQRGNKQTIAIDKRVKKWGVFEFDLLLFKYAAGPPIWDWWNIINKALYGAATGAQVLRPASISLGAKLNRTTPEYWTFSGIKLEQAVLRGSFIEGEAILSIRGISRKVSFNTTNYIQGTATRNADPSSTPMVPASDISILLDGTDRSTELDNFNLTISRTYKMSGRDATDGINFREFTPQTFDAKLEVQQDPLRSEHMTKFVDDTAITCEVKAQNSASGKQIQFTASKHKGSEQEYSEGEAPSMLTLVIDGQTFNVNTL